MSPFSFLICLDFYLPMMYMENSLTDCSYTSWVVGCQGLFQLFLILFFN